LAMAGTPAAVAARMRSASVINLYGTTLMDEHTDLGMRWSWSE
jgi:hypothetical protein